MKNLIAVLVRGLVIFCILLSAVQNPLAASAANRAAPPPPRGPGQTQGDTGSQESAQHSPPQAGQYLTEREQQRATQAMERVLQKYLSGASQRLEGRITNVVMQGEWARGLGEWPSLTADSSQEGLYLIAHRQRSGEWQALLPAAESLYLSWVEQIPAELAGPEDRLTMRLQAERGSDYWRPEAFRTPAPAALPESNTGCTSTSQGSSPSSPLAFPQMPHVSLPESAYGPAVLTPLQTAVPQPETWMAGQTSISRLGPEERKNLLGVSAEAIEWERQQVALAQPESAEEYNYPSAIDWRNVGGQNFTTAIRNQNPCGSCVAFGTLGAIESRLEIANNNASLNPDLSEAHLYFCNGRVCSPGGWNPTDAMNYARDTGVVDEACYPYIGQEQSCNLCSGWQNRVTRITSWGGTSSVATMKQSLADSGPFEATMAVYSDFFDYSSGVYYQTYGNLEGYHAITIVGYNDTGGYWIAKNSWDTGWGESGWFRIGYGEVGIDDYAYIPVVPGSSDTTPPDGDYNSPQDGNVVGRTVHLSAWATDNQSGVNRVHFTAKWNNQWHLVYSDTTYPYEYDWDLCASGVPDGDIELGLDIYDNAGNEFHLHLKHANPHISKSYNCSCNPSSTQIALYASPDFGGSCVLLGIGDYPSPGSFGAVGNDNTESVRVGSNVQANLCEHDNYQGRCELFVGDDANLSNNYIGSNVVSSVRVQNWTQYPDTPTLYSPSSGGIFTEGDAVSLIWNNAANANEYYAEYWGGPAGTVNSGWQSSTSWYVGQLYAGYAYSWRVKARNAAGESGWSSTWLFTVLPAAPSGLNGQIASCSQINLYWNDNSNAEAGYRIYRDSSLVGDVGVNSTSFQNSGLSPNTAYSYVVKAYRGSIESADSNTVNFTTPGCSGSQPDLTPAQWSGWPYPIVPSSVSGTSVVDTLIAGQTTFIDWGLSNTGTASTGGYTYGDLYLDGYRLAHYDFGDVLAGDSWAFIDWQETILEPGWHLLEVWVDPDDYIYESDETNNYWYGWFYWVGSAPYFDDIENQGYDWDTQGLWHLMDSSTSAYPATYSGYYSWWYGQEATGDYDTGAANTGDLTSPPIYIPFDAPDLSQLYQRPSAPRLPLRQGDQPQGGEVDRRGPTQDAPGMDLSQRASDAEIIQDGGFEAGIPNAYWTEYSTNFGTPLCDVNSCGYGGGSGPHSGYFWAWFGGITNAQEAGYLEQSITIPSGYEQLNFWLEIPSSTTAGYLRVLVDGNELFRVTQADASSYATYQSVWVDISAYANGGVHTLRFDSVTYAGAGPTNFFVDDVAIVRGLTPYYLRFQYLYETEAQGTVWDQRWVQISVDGGPFENVLQLSDDPDWNWLQSPAIDLSAYAGHVIQVRYHFDSIDEQFNNYRGWYIDDLNISTTPPPPCSDPYEPNGAASQAVGIQYGGSLDAEICPQGDLDFYTFSGQAGDHVVIDIDARSQGSDLDSYIFLLGNDGQTILAENDDEYTSLDSHLGYILEESGTYYIKVRAYGHPSVGGSAYYYRIHLLNDLNSPATSEITAPLDYEWINPVAQSITAAAEDAESGIRLVEFWWHDSDWVNSSWIWLGDDYVSDDSWSLDANTGAWLEQEDGAFYVLAYDWAGNWAGSGSWELGLDRTPPAAAASVGQLYGNAPFIDFYVFWDGSDNLSTIQRFDIEYRDGAGGSWTELISSSELENSLYRFVGTPGHTYYFRARAADFAGNLGLYAGGNGDTQYTVTICATSADAYESDNTFNAARNILPDSPLQLHNMHGAGDQDWFRLYAEAGIQYTLQTTNPGSHADTIIYLYSIDQTLLAMNDDDPDNWPASRLVWTPVRDGFYFVKILHWDPWAYGCTTQYGFSIVGSAPSGQPEQLFLPMLRR